MPKITEISRQQHDSKRYSVFVDGEYAFSLTDEAVAENRLAVGIDVNSLPLKQIIEEDSYRRALAKAYKSLAVAAKTEKQMSDYLYKKEFEEETVVRVIEHLKELNYINDGDYAADFCESSKRLGRRAVEFKLKQKGISEEIIRKALEKTDDGSQIENAKALAQKRLSKYAKLQVYEKKRKLSAYLASRGFDWDTVREAVEAVVDSEDDI